MSKLSDRLRCSLRQARERFVSAIPDYVPPGFNWQTELKFAAAYWCIAVLVSLWFFVDLGNAINDLYYYDGIRRVLSGAMMEDFSQIIRGKMSMLNFSIVLAAALSALHLCYHYLGSKSIYTMRRLPQRFELLKRCVSVPLAIAAVMLITACILTLLYYWAYMANVPPVCLVPGQWERFVASIFGG